MYDELTNRYTFSCPERGETRVTLSSFRQLERLPGAAHPAVYEVRFACPCGSEHQGLLTDEDLDWAPLGLGGDTSFLNLMTNRLEALESELAALAAQRIGAGEWPWSFFCFPEDQTSINLVSHEHLDVPFHNDAHVGVVDHVFAADAPRAVEEFTAELYSSRFDARRLALGR